jgi:AmmeMemoRadiSam system protein A
VVGLDEAERRQLLDIARAAIRHGIAHHRELVPDLGTLSPRLHEERACFVTLHLDGRLRGCVGTLAARAALAVEVAQAAYSAAFRDPRFPPVEADEVERLHLHISVLSRPTPMGFTSEPDLLAQLRPGVDGLVMRDRGRSGTFLPSVWESIPEPKRFLRHLRLKAGLPADHWSETLVVERYVTESFD